MLATAHRTRHRFQELGNCRCRLWGGLPALVEDVQQAATAPVNDTQRENMEDAERDFRGDEWYGRTFSGRDACLAAVNAPHEPTMKTLETMEQQLAGLDLPKPVSRKRRRRFSEDVGDAVDYDRLRSGQPYWEQTRREARTGPQVVSLVAQIGGNCETSHHKLIWRGAGALVLSELFEEAGYRTEIHAVFRSVSAYARPRSRDVFAAIKLKDAADKPNRVALVNGMSGWFFRSVLFSGIRMDPEFTPRITLGHACRPTDEQLALVTGPNATRVVVGDELYSPEAVARFVGEAVRQIEETNP